VQARYRLAIDLGTSHTVAVVRRDRELPRPLLFDGSPLLPSAVYAEPGGRLHAGRDAERMAALEPARFEPYPKRRVDEGRVLLGDTEVDVVDALAAPLRRVAAEAAQAGVGGPGAAVLTCPADWGPQRRSVLRAAAGAAGLGEVALVEEPIAAATYCLRVLDQRIPAGGCLTVFDFGGGTLDVTVVRRDPDGLRVLAVGGLDDLGGVDVDAALVGHLGQLVALRAPGAWRRLERPSDTGELRARRAFWDDVRGAKEMLSRTAAAPVPVPGTADALHLTREELERVAGPLIDRAVDETRRVLQRAGLPAERMAGILLVGGSSRIPLVASRLHARFGLAPTVPEQPELPVAYGALLAVEAAGAPAVSSPPGSSPPVSTPPGSAAVLSSPPVSGAAVSGAALSGAAGAPRPAGPVLAPPVPIRAAPIGPGSVGPVAAGVPAPRRPGRRRLTVALVAGVALALLGGLGAGGYRLGTAVLRQARASGSGGLGTGTTGGGAPLRTAGQPVALTGTGVAAVTSDGQSVYYADVRAGSTHVVAVPAGGSSPRWQADVPMEPADLRARLAGGQLILDGQRAATHGGANARAVIDPASGRVRWTKAWPDRLDVSYLGTDAIVEQRGSKPALLRVDLLSGATRWTRPGADDLVIIDERLAAPALTWPQPGTPGSAAPPYISGGADTAQFRESLGVDPAVVVSLDSGNGTGAVVDAGSGRTRVSAALPLDVEKWTAYDGAVIGVLNSSASPGRTTVAAYRLNTLARMWEIPVPAGGDVELVKPCGEHLVCVAASSAGGGKTVTAYTVASKQHVWQRTGDFSVDPRWYLLGGELVLGDGPFVQLGEAAAVDPTDGKQRRAFDEGNLRYQVLAGDGTRVVLSYARANTAGQVVFRLVVADLVSGARSGELAVGAEPPKQVVLAGDTVAALTADHRIVVASIPSR
jgi:molecular chaperone HscA